VIYAHCAIVSVMALGSNNDKSKQVDEAGTTECDTVREGDSVAVDEDSAVDGTDHADSSGYKRRSLKGKPRIPTAVDTSRLNKHLTNIWSSKRKKTTKKMPVDSPQAGQLMEAEVESSDQDGAAGDHTAVGSQASTVIIVKTLPQKETESYHSLAKVKKVSEDVEKTEVQKGSRDIAERLKARKQRFAASLGGSDVDASVNCSGQVTCELCAETVSDYMQLVQHVCQHHEDCTYVRSYLDEIQPIADALCAVSLPCKACGRTFAGQAALSAHRHECSAVSKDGHVSKLSAQRRRVSANLLSPSEHATDHNVHSQQNGAASLATKRSRRSAPVKLGHDHQCIHCKRTFSTPDNLAKHVARVHSQKDTKRASGGRRGKASAATATSKSAALSSAKLQQPASAGHVTAPASSGRQFQRCDHCTASFSRTSLLVTHMRYCLKATSNR